MLILLHARIPVMLVDAFSTVYLPLPRMAAECITQVMQVGEHIEYYVDVSVQLKVWHAKFSTVLFRCFTMFLS